jgi:PEP-CTERM motif
MLNTLDQRFYSAVNVLTAGGTAPNFNHTAFNFATQTPVDSADHREPDMGLGMAWLQYAAYWRNRTSHPTWAAAYLNAVDWSLAYYQQTSTNPDYEVLTPFGVYTAARMNAEQGRNYDIQKMVNWVFTRSDARPSKIMISGPQWGGQDVGGLMGFTNSNPGDYAFSMNTFITAMPMLPLVRYEDRYSRAIGKWMLNAANAARLFYADSHTPQTQSSSFWTGDPNSSVAYEGLRHHWLAPGDSEELYAAGDPLTYGWGPQTDFGVYGSAVSGVFGSIIKTTNVDKILQLDLLATDTYHDTAYKTYLYYNPLPTAQSVSIDLGTGSHYDLYDAVSNRYLARQSTGQTFFNIPSDEAVQLVLVPSGGTETRQGRELLVNGVVIDYNATLLANNMIRNPDVDTAVSNDPNHPAFWHYSTNATWSSQQALSPSHSLGLVDNSATTSEEWRTYSTTLDPGTNRTLQLRWYWKYSISSGDEFRARLRLSNDQVTTLDLTNPTSEFDFTVSGSATDFQMFETTIAVPDAVQSFDLTFISAGAAAATGSFYIDDISAALLVAPILTGDYNQDGVVDAADYEVWRNTFGQSGSGLAADGDGDNMVTQLDYDIWKSHFGQSGGSASSGSQRVPEPSTVILLALGFVGSIVLARPVADA